MKTTTQTQQRGIWPTNVQPSSLIVNLFAITDIVKNKDKVSCLLSNIGKEISKRSKFPPIDNTIAIADHGVNWVFDVTIDASGNFGLLFTGLTSISGSEIQ